MLRNQIAVIVSAMAGVTNSLITKCNELSTLGNINSLQEYDAAIASGEIVTSALLALQLQHLGIKAKSLQGWQVPIITDDVHGSSKIIELNPHRINELLNQDIIPVITGFQGISGEGNITTLGKGGSDTSAAIIAAALKAERCDIYTDVNGIYTADPRIIHDAKKINEINIDELYSLCFAGAKVLHPRAALAAKRYGFKLRIISSFTDCIGTVATNKIKTMENKQVTAITSNKNLLQIVIEHQNTIIASIIKSFFRENITIEKTYNFKQDVSVIIANLADQEKCKKLLNELKQSLIIEKYSIEADISSVTIIGYGIKNDSDFIADVAKILDDNQIEIFSTDISDIKISMLIDEKNNEKVIRLLHDYCFSEIELF
jgi:aspartate kinase